MTTPTNSSHSNGLRPPFIRLALSTVSTVVVNALKDPERQPSMLYSFIYFESILRRRSEMFFRDWVLDSGAFTAHASGEAIRLEDYIRVAKHVMTHDKTCSEIFSLDVIGDWKASLRNVEKMWNAGVPAIPTFHYGSPQHALKTLASLYPKIALGGMAMPSLRGMKAKKLAFVNQCLARVWPKKVHAFGVADDTIIMQAPLHSIDASSWVMQPQRYGMYKLWGKSIPVRGSKHNLRAQVDYYLELETAARERWANEMRTLEEL